MQEDVKIGNKYIRHLFHLLESKEKGERAKIKKKVTKRNK
jgi:hypothetical protein